MNVFQFQGEDISGTKLGEPLFIRIELDSPSIFDIFARNLVLTLFFSFVSNLFKFDSVSLSYFQSSFMSRKTHFTILYNISIDCLFFCLQNMIFIKMKKMKIYLFHFQLTDRQEWIGRRGDRSDGRSRLSGRSGFSRFDKRKRNRSADRKIRGFQIQRQSVYSFF